MQYSVDGGVTWLESTNNVRVIYRDMDAVFDDDCEPKELHVNLTNEGIICDVIESRTGEVVGTRCEMYTDVIDDLTDE